MSICPAKHWLLWWLGVSPFLLQTLFIAWLCCTWNVHVAIVHIFFHTILYIPPFTPMHLENRMILKKFKSKLFSCARKKVKVFLPTPIFRLVMTNLHRRVTVGERTSCRAILSLPAPTDQVFKGRHLRSPPVPAWRLTYRYAGGAPSRTAIKAAKAASQLWNVVKALNPL